jgi:glycosyltransferase involved in cell wall biosynthesis
MYPLVSVVIPTHNCQRFVAHAIRSAIDQKYPNIEILVVDDGSTDSTFDIVQQEAGAHAFRYWQQERAGPGAARNRGIKEAAGEWIAFLDGDDYWPDDLVLKLVEKANSDSELAMVYGSKLVVDASGESLPDQPSFTLPSGWIFGDLFRNNLVATPSVMVRALTLREVGTFDQSRDLTVGEDYDLWMRIAAVARIGAVPDVKCVCRRHQSNTTGNAAVRARGVITAVLKAASLVSSGKVDRRNDLRGLAPRKRLRDLYSNAVLATYYQGNYKACRAFAIESLGNGLVTRALMEKVVLSFVPHKILENLRALKKGYRQS